MKARTASLVFSALTLTAGIVACRGGVSQAIPPNFPANAANANLRVNHDSTPSKSTIKHVVIVIQENRSFDNFFATFPGADGTTTGKAKTMPSAIADACRSDGMPVITKPTSVPLTKVSLLGKGFPGNFGMDQDLDHIHTGYLLMMDHNKMDGWDVTKFGANGEGTPTCTYSYQYVDPNEIKPYWDMATQYVLADHTFQTQGSGSFTGHQDLIAAGTKISASEALIDNPSYFPWGCDANDSVVTAVIKKGSQKVYPFGGPFPCLEYDTMRDLLDAKGVSWKFYAMPVQKESGCEHGDTAGIWSAFDAIKAVRYSDEWHTNVTRTNKAIFSDIDAGNYRRFPGLRPTASNPTIPWNANIRRASPVRGRLPIPDPNGWRRSSMPSAKASIGTPPPSSSCGTIGAASSITSCRRCRAPGRVDRDSAFRCSSFRRASKRTSNTPPISSAASCASSRKTGASVRSGKTTRTPTASATPSI